MQRISFWQVFRLVFVIFSLYLMGDAFYRWDGFSYYAPFSEFLLSLALVSIFWTIVAAFISLLIWFLIIASEVSGLLLKLQVQGEQLFIFIIVSGLSGAIVWFVKRLVFSDQTTLQIKLILYFPIILLVTFFVWLFRNKLASWLDIIQERITPLVWLFAIFVVISVPLVAYHTWFKGSDHELVKEAFHSGKKNEKLPNIILTTFDALSARNMSVYDYQLETTPFIAEWSKKASIFTRLYAESNFTGPTTASLMTGKRVWTHQKYDPHEYGSKPVRSYIENLALELKNNGYYTMAFIPNDSASVETLGIKNSFLIAPRTGEFFQPAILSRIISKFINQLFSDKIRLSNWIINEDFIFGKLISKISGEIYETEYPAERVFSRFIGTIDRKIPEPFFAWIHLYPPHARYLPPKPFMGMFDNSDKFRTYKSQDYLIESIQGQQPTNYTLRARYDEFIRYCDKQFEDFIKQLETRNILNKSLVILSADHGEIFEHGFVTHGTTLYEPETNIPLIIKEPGRQQGRIINDLVEQIDIPATILDFAEIPLPPWMEGCSLKPLMHGEYSEPKPAFSMVLEKNPSRGHEIKKGIIAIWEGDYKLISYLEENKSLLFNLNLDPGELNNIFEDEPERGHRLLSILKENLNQANERIRGTE